MTGNYTKSDLEKENAKLKRRLGELESILGAQKSFFKGLSGAGIFLMLGPSLVISLRNFFNQQKHEQGVSNTTKAELAAAIIRRVFYVGFVGLLAILLPAMMMLWQNFELRAQTKQIARELALQVEVTTRSQLAAAFGDSRKKREAINLLLDVETQRKSPLNLQGIDISGVVISDRDLSRADFRHAVVVATIFENVMLDYANFSYSNAVSVKLIGLQLRQTNFKNAQLQMAQFKNADLTSANFHGAILTGADFSGAIVTNTNFNGACIDLDEPEALRTRWPDGFDPQKAGIKKSCQDNYIESL